MRILAVDDDPIIQDLLRDSLAAQGQTDLTLASSAEEAVALLEAAKRPFETFLLDIHLPGSDGIDLCRQIRAQDRHRMTPIIMITASREPDMMHRAFDAGATDYVSKPFDSLELGTRVKLAQMLNESVLREQSNRHRLEELTRLTRIEFDERVALTGIDGICDILEIENQLLRSTTGCYAMSLLAVEMISAHSRYSSVSAAQFRQDLDSIGKAIADSVNVGNTRVAYAGHGIFVLVLHGRKRIDVRSLSQEINNRLADEWSPISDTARKAPETRTLEISGNRLWSGMAASNALNAFLSKSDRIPMIKRAEEEQLFAAMRKRMFQSD